MYGGSVGKKMRDDAIRRARAVNTVSPVKPVLPTAQGSTKPAGVETKEISAPNGKISYAVTAECKKIYISESQAIKLKNE